MKLYLVIHDDRHQSRVYRLFKGEKRACDYARRVLADHIKGTNRTLDDQTESLQRYDADLLMYVVYSCEGDHVEVREVEVS